MSKPLNSALDNTLNSTPDSAPDNALDSTPNNSTASSMSREPAQKALHAAAKSTERRAGRARTKAGVKLWIAPFFKQYRGALALALFLGVCTFIFASALMVTSGYLISLAAEDPLNVALIFFPVALVRVFGIGKPILHYLERLTSHDWILRMTSSMRLKLYNILEKDAIFFKKRYRTGDILGILAEDIGHIQNLYLRTIFPTIVAWALYVLIICILGLFSLWFALCMALLLAVLVFLLPLVSMLVNGAHQTRRKVMKNALYEQVTDNVLGVNDWIISGRGSEYVQTYRSSEKALRKVDTRLNRSSRGRDLLLQALFALVVIALLMWAGSEFGGQYAGIGNWIAAFALAFFPLIDAFAPLSSAAIETNRHRDSIDRLGELRSQNGVEDYTGTLPQAPFVIESKQLAYKYPDGVRSVLDGLDLTIQPGEKLAILGRSGSGKSTFATLLRGDLTPTEGSVTINGIAPSLLGDQISHYIGVIQQQTYLFNTTLAENLRIGNQAASDEELWMALEQVGLKSLAERLPDGLETLVDEAGLRFSGGERHRIALARVLLHKVPIVILDEPTVGLDPVTEQALLDTIFETMRDKTIIMITHHLQGVSAMDRIIFIEEGKLTLSGSPEDLAQNNSYYQSLRAFDKGSLTQHSGN
ncbi:MAG: thiol reductant ABC exporter subunit CydC [Coriobacteriia bacterium]|nr:thiol reductant ABC exporter subunit CydC [Coriobacteriia bacterium]